MRQLNDKQQIFVDLMVQELYPTVHEAFTAAGYDGGESAAYLQLKKLREHIAEGKALVQQERAKLIALDKVSILEQMAAIALVDMKDFFESNDGAVQLKSWNTIPDQAKRAIKKVKTTTDKDGNQNVQLEFHDKLAGLEKLKQWVYGDGQLLTAGDEDSKTEDVQTIIHVVENGRMEEKKEN